MSAAKKKIAPGDTFVRITRGMLESATWPLLNINARRLLDFLMLEHLRHGGKENGKLLAPWDQLVVFGIGRRLIGEAIKDAKVLGFIDVKEGIGRAPSTYTLTWAADARRHDADQPVADRSSALGEPQHVGSPW